MAVLQIVDVDLAVAIADRAHDRRDLGQRLRREAREQLGQRPRLLVGVARAERNQHVQASGAARLHDTSDRPIVSHSSCRCFAIVTTSVERRALRIEIEDHQSGRSKRRHAARPNVQRNRAHVGDVEQRLAGRRARSNGSRARACSLHIVSRRSQLRRVDRRVLLKKRLAVDAVGVTRQDHGPVLEIRQQPLCDAFVVGNQVAFRVALGGPEHLVEVRQPLRTAGGSVASRTARAPPQRRPAATPLA